MELPFLSFLFTSLYSIVLVVFIEYLFANANFLFGKILHFYIFLIL